MFPQYKLCKDKLFAAEGLNPHRHPPDCQCDDCIEPDPAMGTSPANDEDELIVKECQYCCAPEDSVISPFPGGGLACSSCLEFERYMFRKDEE